MSDNEDHPNVSSSEDEREEDEEVFIYGLLYSESELKRIIDAKIAKDKGVTAVYIKDTEDSMKKREERKSKKRPRFEEEIEEKEEQQLKKSKMEGDGWAWSCDYHPEENMEDELDFYTRRGYEVKVLKDQKKNWLFLDTLRDCLSEEFDSTVRGLDSMTVNDGEILIFYECDTVNELRDENPACVPVENSYLEVGVEEQKLLDKFRDTYDSKAQPGWFKLVSS